MVAHAVVVVVVVMVFVTAAESFVTRDEIVVRIDSRSNDAKIWMMKFVICCVAVASAVVFGRCDATVEKGN